MEAARLAATGLHRRVARRAVASGGKLASRGSAAARRRLGGSFRGEIAEAMAVGGGGSSRSDGGRYSG